MLREKLASDISKSAREKLALSPNSVKALKALGVGALAFPGSLAIPSAFVLNKLWPYMKNTEPGAEAAEAEPAKVGPAKVGPAKVDPVENSNTLTDDFIFRA